MMTLTAVLLGAVAAQEAPPMKVTWRASVQEAREAARREGKLLFVYRLVGDLTREKC